MNKKIYIEKCIKRKSPYRIKYGNLYVYLASEDEAKRVKKFIKKLVNYIEKI